MKKFRVTLTNRSAITLPKEICEKHSFQPGDCFDCQELPDGSIRLVKLQCCHLPAFQPICKMVGEK